MIWLFGLGRPMSILACAIADHASRRFEWRLAVSCVHSTLMVEFEDDFSRSRKRARDFHEAAKLTRHRRLNDSANNPALGLTAAQGRGAGNSLDHVHHLGSRIPYYCDCLTTTSWDQRVLRPSAAATIAPASESPCGVLGLGPFLLVQLPITLLAGSIGVWLFYVQHQFEDTFWTHDEGWNFHEAALRGSSHDDLPNVLRWFTANIGVHHVHHLCSRIPYYRLPRVLRDHPELAAIGRLTLLESLRCVRMVLWDERRRRLISFREMHILTSVMNRRTAALPNQT